MESCTPRNPAHIVSRSSRATAVIAAASEFKLARNRFVGLSDSSPEAELGPADDRAQRPFDLASGPLFISTPQAALGRLHLALHHAPHRLRRLVAGRVRSASSPCSTRPFSHGPPQRFRSLPIQYADYAVWQRQWLQGEVLESQLAYWQQQLGGAPPVLELPTDRPRPAVADLPGCLPDAVRCPDRCVERLKALSQREGVTLFMTLLAAFQALLHRADRSGRHRRRHADRRPNAEPRREA